MRIRIVTEGASSAAKKKASPIAPGGPDPDRGQAHGPVPGSSPYRIPATSRAASRSTFCW
jgi:hypothetical protein